VASVTQSTSLSAQEAAQSYGITLFTVRSPSGYEADVMTREEADWYEDRRQRYTSDNHFPNVSDLQDLDRLLMFELMTYRWSVWLSRGFDYLGARIDEGQLKTSLKEYSTETRLLKQNLGIDKATRDKEKGESLADYTESLTARAREFGIHRNEQYQIVVTKFFELASLIRTYDRCDDEERAQLDLSHASVFEWIRKQVLEPFDEHAAAFRKNQAIWVREM
jgi:hypothetical protein